MAAKRVLDDVDRQTIRDQLAEGVPRERIAAEARVTLKQVDAIRAHVTIAKRRKRLTNDQMLQLAYRHARMRARAKDVKCLTPSDCRDLWRKQEGRCAISGKRFSDRQVNYNAKVLSRPWRPSLDRINPRRGYERRNVRLVAQIVNFGLGEWPLEVFRDMCRRVARNRKYARGAGR